MTDYSTREFARDALRVAWLALITVLVMWLAGIGLVPGDAVNVVLAGAAWDALRFAVWDVPRYVNALRASDDETEDDGTDTEPTRIDTYREDTRGRAERAF